MIDVLTTGRQRSTAQSVPRTQARDSCDVAPLSFWSPTGARARTRDRRATRPNFPTPCARLCARAIGA